MNLLYEKDKIRLHEKMVFFTLLGILSIIASFSFVHAQEFENDQINVNVVADNLEIPWAISFAPDGRIFFTERNGALRVIEEGKLNPEPVTELNVGIVEGGLLGIALDPNFDQNHFIYLYYTYSEFLSTYNKVVRYTEKDNTLSDEFIVLDKIPGAPIHDGGRLKFGPDGKLFITTGDAANSNSAQDLDSLAGKILRINPDGSIPSDNPFADSLIFSYGHRNPQGLDWDPVSGKLVSTEHGPSGERGFAHDEINVIEAGKNYGWPKIIGGEDDADFVNPIFHTGDDTWAPSGATFYNSQNIPEWENKYFVATLRGSQLIMLDLDLEENKVISNEVVLSDFGRLRDASMGPEGNLYILTSNRDGRGSPAENDDMILRIVPVSSEYNRVIFDRPVAPLKQFEMGVEPRDVKCNIGFELIIKSSNEMPACVFPDSASKLVSKGWGMWP